MNLRFAPTSQAILGRDGRVDAHWERWFGDLARAVNAASGSGDSEQAEPASVSLVQGQGIAITGTGTQDSPWVVRLRDLRDSGTGDALVKITRDSYGRVAGTEEASASDLPYDNTDSGMVAEDVQAALDELADEKLDDAPSDGNFYGRRDGAWALGGGGSGAMTLVGTATVAGSAATSLTLSSLDLDADGHYHIVYALKNAVGSATDIYLHYNGDTASANYYNQYISGNSGITGARSNQPLITGMGGNEGVCGVITVTKGYDGKPRAIIQANRGAPSGIIMQVFGHAWNVASGVTSITLTATTANALAVGSYFKVFKLN